MSESSGWIGLVGAILAFVESRCDEPVVFPAVANAIVGYDSSVGSVRWRREFADFLPGDGKTEFQVETLEAPGSRLAFDRDVDFIACTDFVEVGDVDCDGDRDHAFGLYLLPVNGRAHCLSRLVIVSGRNGATIRSETLAHEEIMNDQIGSLLPGVDPDGSGQRGVFVTLPYVLVRTAGPRGACWFVPADRERPARLVEMTESPSNSLRRREGRIDEATIALASPEWGASRAIVERGWGRHVEIEVQSVQASGRRRFEWSPPDGNPASKLASVVELIGEEPRLLIALRPVNGRESWVVYALAPSIGGWETAWQLRDARLVRVESDRDGDGSVDVVVSVVGDRRGRMNHLLVSGRTGATLAELDTD